MSSQLEIINISIVNEAKDLMGERFPTMIKYFLEDTEMYLNEIEKGIAEKNIQVSLSPAHTIKSSAKQLGAERVSDVARQIETMCREMQDHNTHDFTALDRLFSELKEEMEAASPLLKELATK